MQAEKGLELLLKKVPVQRVLMEPPVGPLGKVVAPQLVEGVTAS